MPTMNELHAEEAVSAADLSKIDMKMEVIIIPVSDLDRSREFYRKLGWRLDQTPPGVVQLTPHGSPGSVQFGGKLTSAVPGSGSGYLIVSDIVATRNALLAAGIKVGELFHLGANGFEPGLDPERRTYRSRAIFQDPDGNTWILQEITNRLPGRV